MDINVHFNASSQEHLRARLSTSTCRTWKHSVKTARSFVIIGRCRLIEPTELPMMTPRE